MKIYKSVLNCHPWNITVVSGRASPGKWRSKWTEIADWTLGHGWTFFGRNVVDGQSYARIERRRIGSWSTRGGPNKAVKTFLTRKNRICPLTMVKFVFL